MGAGASQTGPGGGNGVGNGVGGGGGGQVFGGGAGGGVRNGDELTAEQLQLLIQAGRLQYGGASGQNFNGDVQPQQPTPQFRSAKVTKNPFNLKKNTVKLTKPANEGDPTHVEFEFDAAEPCIVSVHYFAREYVTPDHLTVKFVPEPNVTEALVVPPPLTFSSGMNQKFMATHSSECAFDVHSAPAAFASYDEHSSCYPLIIDLRSIDETLAHQDRTAQTTFLTLDANRTTVKSVKQKVSVGGQAYELHDIYGISANVGDEKTGEEDEAAVDEDDGDSLCVICLSDPRDTAVLPCRHMCLCSDCAQSLRTQSNKCPICRGPVQSLLHIKVET